MNYLTGQSLISRAGSLLFAGTLALGFTGGCRGVNRTALVSPTGHGDSMTAGMIVAKNKVAVHALAVPAAPSPRIVRLLDRNWQLHTMPTDTGGQIVPMLTVEEIKKLRCPWPAGSWTPVNLPDDYIVAGKFSRHALGRYAPPGESFPVNRYEFSQHAWGHHGYLPVFPAWYYRRLSVPAADNGKTIWLNFGGVYRDAVVFVNGHCVGQHPSGYTGFRYNISPLVHVGHRNTLAVYVDPRWFEGWWYEGGGIYRHVRLIITDKLHVEPWGTFVISRVPGKIHDSSSFGDEANVQLAIKTTVKNAHKSGRSFILISRVMNPKGNIVAVVSSPEHLAAGKKETFTQHTPLANAALWSLHHCNLYHLLTDLEVNHRRVDDKRTTFGIRTLKFDPNRGFFLNGRHVEIKGTCNHQDFPAVGIAAPDNLWFWRIAKLRAMGSNAYRTAHNPLASAFYRACDHLGMLVMDENRHLGDTYLPKAFPGVKVGNLADLKTMVLQARNDPCVIMWSLCNEEWRGRPPLQASHAGALILQPMLQLVHRLDPTRPATSAMSGGFNRRGFASAEDIIGMNYSYPVYFKTHRLFPRKMIFGSEDQDGYSARGAVNTNIKAGLISEFGEWMQKGKEVPVWGNAPWNSAALVLTHRFIAGEFIWTGFDYRGEPNPTQWPDVSNNTGMMDLCGFPKTSYYFWKACWTKAPLVYIFPAWNFPNSMIGQPIRIRCYSNCRRVALFLNGRSLGGKRMKQYKYLDWTVPYVPGTLEARGYNAGRRMAAHDTLRTAGPAVALRLTDEFTPLRADGESIAPIAVAVVDDRGQIVPAAANKVYFSVRGLGKIAGVGNGDPASHEPNRTDYRRAFHGRCMVLVRAGYKPGIIRVTATARGLKPAILELRTQSPSEYGELP